MIHIFLGMVLIALGIGVISAQLFATFASIYFLGWIVLAAGVGEFFYGITSGNLRSTMFYVLTGLVGVFIGLITITNPALSAVAFTVLLSALLLFSGAYRTIATLITRGSNWGWHLLGGIASLMLGLAIVIWPLLSLFFLGFFIGIELLINGALLMMQPAVLYEYEEEREYRTSPHFAGAKGGKAKKDKEEKEEHKKPTRGKYTKSRSRKVD